MSNKVVIFLKLIAAGVLIQTLFFKFTGAPESVYIFSTIGIEPWGRWASGFSELIASIFLLVPKTEILGASMGVGIMAGALASHALFLGISVQNDGGLLFTLACVVFTSCLGIIFLKREEVPLWIERLLYVKKRVLG